MKKFVKLTASTLFLMLALSVSSFGWNDRAHMVIALVAYQRLNRQTRARVDELVALNPNFNEWSDRIPPGTSASDKRLMLFMIASTWVDRMKLDGKSRRDDAEELLPNGAAPIIGYSDMSMHRSWHFVDQPFSPDNTPLPKTPVPNTATQIGPLREILASTSPDSTKSYALMWLVHLVGDIHQPLHASSRFTSQHPNGDAGGNFVTICDPQCGKRMHAFWDALLGTGSDPTVDLTMGRKMPVVAAIQANNLNVATWLSESLDEAKNTAYASPIGIGPGPFVLTLAYQTKARSVALHRVVLAGARLANILNAELK